MYQAGDFGACGRFRGALYVDWDRKDQRAGEGHRSKYHNLEQIEFLKLTTIKLNFKYDY